MIEVIVDQQRTGEEILDALDELVLAHRVIRLDQQTPSPLPSGVTLPAIREGDRIIVGAVLRKRGIRCMTRTGCSIRVLVLLDMDEMAVQVRNQNRKRCAVRVVFIAGVFDGIGYVNAGRSGSFRGLLNSSAPGFLRSKSP